MQVRSHLRMVSLSAKPEDDSAEDGPHAPDSLPYAKGSATSQAAAEAITQDRKNAQEAAVMALLRRHGGGLTDEQIGKWLACSMQASSARRARIMLRDAGRVRCRPDKRRAATGAMVWVWEAAE